MLIKQISTATVFGEKSDIQALVLSDKTMSHFLYRIVGRVEGYMIGKGKHKRVDPETGEASDSFWTKFAGDFAAINARNEEFEAAICFLPEYISGPIAEAMKDDADVTVPIKFDIFAVFSKKSATSYEFVAQPIKKAGESTARALMSDLPALPGAPKQAQIAGPKPAMESARDPDHIKMATEGKKK